MAFATLPDRQRVARHEPQQQSLALAMRAVALDRLFRGAFHGVADGAAVTASFVHGGAPQCGISSISFRPSQTAASPATTLPPAYKPATANSPRRRDRKSTRLNSSH